MLIFRPMFEFSGRAPRAGLETLAGRIRHAGRTLETPVLVQYLGSVEQQVLSPVCVTFKSSKLHMSAVYMYVGSCALNN